MSKTKKGLMLAGAILGIVLASLMILGGVICVGAMNVVDEQFVTKIFDEDPEYVLVPGANEGEYTYVYTPTNGVADPSMDIDNKEVSMIVKISKVTLGVGGIVVLALAVCSLVSSIQVLKSANKGVTKKGPVITLLVFSALLGNLVTMGFMIAVLCMRDKRAEDNEPTDTIVVE